MPTHRLEDRDNSGGDDDEDEDDDEAAITAREPASVRNCQARTLQPASRETPNSGKVVRTRDS